MDSAAAVLSDRSPPAVRAIGFRGRKRYFMDTKSRPLNAAIIGLGFGAEFIPIYQRHPDANVAAICRRNEAKLNKLADAFGIDKRYTRYEDVLADPAIDFVHINSPIPDHAWMSHRGAAGRQARDVHRADGHDDRRLREDLPARGRDRPQVHDGRDGRLQPRVPVHQARCTRRASSARFSTCRRRIRRTWTAGPTIGSG